MRPTFRVSSSVKSLFSSGGREHLSGFAYFVKALSFVALLEWLQLQHSSMSPVLGLDYCNKKTAHNAHVVLSTPYAGGRIAKGEEDEEDGGGKRKAPAPSLIQQELKRQKVRSRQTFGPESLRSFVHTGTLSGGTLLCCDSVGFWFGQSAKG